MSRLNGQGEQRLPAPLWDNRLARLCPCHSDPESSNQFGIELRERDCETRGEGGHRRCGLQSCSPYRTSEYTPLSGSAANTFFCGGEAGTAGDGRSNTLSLLANGESRVTFGPMLGQKRDMSSTDARGWRENGSALVDADVDKASASNWTIQLALWPFNSCVAISLFSVAIKRARQFRPRSRVFVISSQQRKKKELHHDLQTNRESRKKKDSEKVFRCSSDRTPLFQIAFAHPGSASAMPTHGLDCQASPLLSGGSKASSGLLMVARWFAA